MKGRCLNPRHMSYKNYGGRGITVAAEWLDFATFYKDIGKRPSPAHTLERVDNDGPYAAWNCKWATRPEQARNRRSNHLLTHNGETMTITDWGLRYHVSPTTINGRLSKGWTIEEALTTPPQKRGYKQRVRRKGQA